MFMHADLEIFSAIFAGKMVAIVYGDTMINSKLIYPVIEKIS